MAIYKHLLASNVKTSNEVGVLVLSNTPTGHQRKFAKIGKICNSNEEQKLLGDSFVDYKPGRDLLLQTETSSCVHFVPFILNNVIEFSYPTGKPLVWCAPEVEIEIGAPQLIIELPAHFVLLGQSEEYMQSVCETIVALCNEF